jgi:hypothetical protein
MKPWLKLLDDPRLPQIAIVGLLLIMAALTPRLMYGWIDEFWIVKYGQNIFGHTEIEPQHSLYWGGACLSALFHEWLPGMFGQRWLSWLSTVGMALAALRLGRLMNVNRTTAALLVVLLLLAPEVRFEGQNGRVDNLAMMWVFLALGQTHLALTSSPRHAWTAGALSLVAVWTWITAVVPLLALLPLFWHHRAKLNWAFLWRGIGGALLTALAIFVIAPQNAVAGFDVLLEQLRWRWAEGAAKAAASIPPDWGAFRITLMLGGAMMVWSGVNAWRAKPTARVAWFLQLVIVLFALWLTVRTNLYHARIVYWIHLVVAISFIAGQITPPARTASSELAPHRMLLTIALIFGVWQGPKMFFSIRNALRKPPLELALRERIAHLGVKPGQVVATFSREYAPFVAEVGATPVLGEKSWPGADLVIGSQYGPAGEVIEAAGFERVVWPEGFANSARFQPLPDVYKSVRP